MLSVPAIAQADNVGGHPATQLKSLHNAQVDAFKQSKDDFEAFLGRIGLAHRAAALEEFGVDSLSDYLDPHIVSIEIFSFKE